MERYGSGITRILRICKEYGVIPPTVEEEKDGFVVTVYNEKLKDGVKDGVKKISTNQREILKYMALEPNITAIELSEYVGINKRNIENNISKLKEKGLLKRIGSDKTGYWEIIEGEK